jgi:HSP20 family protein
VDVSESDKALAIRAELPCIEEDDIDVTLNNDGVLSVRGKKKEEKDEDHYMSERRYGSFSRPFHMPDTVDGGKFKAAFDKGVLTMTLPKNAKAKKVQTVKIGKK